MGDEEKPIAVVSLWTKRNHKDGDRPRRTAGLIITAVYLLVMAAYVAIRWDALWASDPNEFGDFLAGVFAPLAFLWLVLGFFQQGDELRQSSEALWLQGQELQNSVEQQRELVNVTREQLDFERRRIAEEAERFIRQSQPDCVILGGGHSGGANGTTKMTFELLNRGATCKEFEFSSNGRRIHHRPLFRGNEKFPFFIEVSPNRPLGREELTATFVDGLGNRGSQILELEVVQNGPFRIMRPPT